MPESSKVLLVYGVHSSIHVTSKEVYYHFQLSQEILIKAIIYPPFFIYLTSSGNWEHEACKR